MLEIEYKGAGCVVIETKKTKVVTDPLLPGQSSLEKTNDAVILATEPRFVADNGAKLVIDGPGEYEVGDFSVRGEAAKRSIDHSDENNTTIYRIEVKDVRIGLLGNIAAPLSEDQLEALGVLDILILPVGGNGYTLDAVAAASLIRQIDPRVVIPVHYQDSAVTYEVPQAPLDEFTKELAVTVEQVTKYKVKSAASLPATLTVVEVQRT